MDVALLAASLTLAAVFAVAGTAKLADRAGARSAAHDFGAPERLAGFVGTGVALAELVVAGLLLPAETRWGAALAALVLLLAFCAAIGVAIARGRQPDCHCFGQLHSSPAGSRTLARNGLFAALAASVVVAGRDAAGPGALAWVERLDPLGWIVVVLAAMLVAVVAVGGAAVVHVLRSYGRIVVRLERVEERLRAAGFELEEPDDLPQLGLAPGTPAPTFWLADVEGTRVALDDLLEPKRPLLLLFTSPTCDPCSMVMPEVALWQRERADELTIALISDGELETVREHAAEHGLEHVLVDESLAVYEAYGANGTPSAVLVGDDGAIASWLAAGAEWIEALVEQALGGLGSTAGLAIGTPLPPLRLEDLDGEERELGDLVDGETLLLFWNPGCGYCRAMLDDVLTWERARTSGAPELVVVSSGDVDNVRAEGFASPVLLDPKWAAASILGADGTPMGVFVDAEGRIASSPVTGSAGLLEVLGAGRLTPTG